MNCGGECSLSLRVSRGLPKSYRGGMTKIATANGGIIGTLEIKVQTPVVFHR
ncbi:MAG: hypothetical protein ACFFCD_07435 [Promethearchaeota archaeon]